MLAAPLLLAQLINVPRAWLVVWAILAALTIALVILLRTRFRGIKPWKTCAILSLWVHVLLGCLIGTVRIATSGPGEGDGYGPPIHVAILPPETDAVEARELSQSPVIENAGETADSDAADELADEPLAEDPEAPAVESLVKEKEADLSPPELLAGAEPAADILQERPEEIASESDEVASMDAVNLDEPDAALSPEHIAAEPTSMPTSSVEPLGTISAKMPGDRETPHRAEVETIADEAIESPATARAAPPREPSDISPQPTPYAARFAAHRDAVVKAGGGGANTERAVAAGLAWLAAAQEENGRWDPKRHGAGRELYVLQQNRGAAGARADTGVSSLALLAFLGAGHTHRDGPYALTVGQGLEFLRRSQTANGSLYGNAELFAQTYCHSMSSFALSEAYALTNDDRLRPAVQAATGYSLAIQHPTDGGWRYRPGDTGDTSQLGWQVMALRSAEQGGLQIPDVTWTRIDRFLRQVVRGRAGGLAVYRPEEARPSRSMTAEALYCRQLVTGRADGGLNADALAESIASLVEEPPSPRSINLYYWYYATLALHRAQHASPQATAAWRTWNDALTQTLLATQRADGCWPETCMWGGYGGRVYTTALATMCLEVYYRYALVESPNQANLGIAQQQEWQSEARR